MREKRNGSGKEDAVGFLLALGAALLCTAFLFLWAFICIASMGTRTIREGLKQSLEDLIFLLTTLRRSSRPIVRVCAVNGRIGIVLRKDYDRASRKQWRPFLKGKLDFLDSDRDLKRYRRLAVYPVFVFDDPFRIYAHREAGGTASSPFEPLLARCYVEDAFFHVPTHSSIGRPSALDDMSEEETYAAAYEHFFGKKPEWVPEPRHESGEIVPLR